MLYQEWLDCWKNECLSGYHQVMVFSMQLYIFVKISEGISQKEHKNIRHCLNLGCLPPGIFGHIKVFQKIWRTKNFLIKKSVLTVL